MEFNVESDGRSAEIIRTDGSRVVTTTAAPVAILDREIRLLDYFSMLRNHVLLITFISALITVPVAYFMLKSPDYYDAKARIEVNVERPEAAGLESLGSTVSNDPAYFNTQLQIISSPALMRRVVRTLDLEHNPIFVRNMSKAGRLIRKLLSLRFFAKPEDQT